MLNYPVFYFQNHVFVTETIRFIIFFIPQLPVYFIRAIFALCLLKKITYKQNLQSFKREHKIYYL